MSRRTVLRSIVAGAGMVVTPGLQRCSVPEEMLDPFYGGRWTGHQPGSIYLGVSRPEKGLAAATSQLGPLGTHRSYFGWYDLEVELATIAADLRQRRLPWVSFKPPFEGPGGWLEVSSGAHDDELRRRAEGYADADGPVVVTFNHEPAGDRTGTPAEFIAAFSHVHDVMRETTGMASVTYVPVLNDWLFNPLNPEGRPLDYLTGPLLDRSDFIGVDIYQNVSGEGFAERLPRVAEVLAQLGRGDLMLGVGETGCTDRLGWPGAAKWWSDSWAWASQHADLIGLVCYFDSLRNSTAQTYWPLNESQAKLSAFANSVESAVSCRLPEAAA